MSHDASLEPVLRAVEPALRLVHERHLRQILNYLTDLGRPLPTNTELPYWFSRADLVAADVLPRAALHGSEPRLLLVTDPNDRMIADKPRAEQLLHYRRVLFRAAVMNAIDLGLATGELNTARCAERLNRFGAAAAREIRFVLENEHLAAPEANDFDRYRAFAAIYLDLDHFTAHAAEAYFPALPNAHTVRSALAEDVPVQQLLASSRPEGAPEPIRYPPADERWTVPLVEPQAPSALPGEVTKLLQRALDAEQQGNVVRAAVLRTQAATAATGEERERAVTGAMTALGQLVDRLGDVLEWDHETRQEWRQALGPLLPVGAVGLWPRAARCLYELQRIPADLSREMYAVDLPEAIRTFGRRPVRRHLPHARPVMVLMALRKAHKQLLRAGLSEQAQLRLDRLLHHEIHRRDHAIRHEFTPIIVRAITEAGLVPANRVEEVARDKVVAELLDRVCERGFLRISNLRDAIARNQLKMPDLAGFGEFFRGDPLLRADTNLAYSLDGVYRRGEFYLRLIQRFVSIFFGTPWGRWLTLYLALPFGGAFLTLSFAEELRHMGGKVAGLVAKSFGKPPAKGQAQAQPVSPLPTQPGAEPPPATPPPEAVWDFDEETMEFYWEEPPTVDFDPVTMEFVLREAEARVKLVTDVFTSSATQQKPEEVHHSVLIAWPTVLGFGVFLLLVFHVPPFRRGVFLVLRYLWWAVRGVLWDIPMALWRSRPARLARQSSTARYLHRHAFSPVVLSLLLLAVMFLLGVSPRWLLLWGWTIIAGLVALYNLPFGWMIQDRIAEALSDWWRMVRVNLIPGLIATIIDWFKMLANWVERQLYAVEEWMRFRGGDSQGSIVGKAILGLLWFPIAYITRFVFYLLVEPQVNPVKHFPVVTVSHKVIWPMVPQLAEWTGASVWTVSMVVNGIPGIFGFIAWELKENWRLYAATRSEKLKPVMVGSHGESMRGLLRPGFHSGTVPKLRRKARHAMAAGEVAKASRVHHELEHVAEGVQRFVARELIPLLEGDPAWGGVAVKLTAVRFGCQRAEVELAAPALGRDPFVLAFENVGGVIDGSVAQLGWADKLTDAQRSALAFALRGVLDLGAAARSDGRERDYDALDEPGLALARRVTWDEWVTRWGGVRERVKG